MMTMILRRFLDLPGRQIHYRVRGQEGGVPLLAFHALPGSARQLEPLMRAIGGRSVIAPDLAGLGDSDARPGECTIPGFAEDMCALLEEIALPEVDLYGTHTGAAVALELAIMMPDRVRRIVLDGVPLFEGADIDVLADRYAPAIEPDHNGGHLLQAHNFCRDMLLFWPWFDKSAAASRGGGLPDARTLHDWVLEVVKGLDAMPGAYRAAFRYDAAARLPLVRQPTLCIAAAADTLDQASRRAANLLPAGELIKVEGVSNGMAPPEAVAVAACRFLDRQPAITAPRTPS